ncbi:hypothetical protein Nepgr_023107 [Nepenthes gracilis]|uniref:Uncharacterized protein n=1 Tax=Nepenthes gracilis TaxID=150966 RepID=A0AAD3T1V7_NEPGR|nr:hypothetical protein Nepgr_023107 [Nepenthes gracilis]
MSIARLLALSCADPDDGVVGSDSVTRAFAAAFHMEHSASAGIENLWCCYVEVLLLTQTIIQFWCWIKFLDLQYDMLSSLRVAAGMADLAVGVLLLLLLRGQWFNAQAFLFLQWPYYLCCCCCVDYVGAGYDALDPFL